MKYGHILFALGAMAGDAATALGGAGTVMTINCGAAYNGSDKTFQFNGCGEMRISNFYVSNAGKLVRS